MTILNELYAAGYCRWYIYTQLYNLTSVINVFVNKNSACTIWLMCYFLCQYNQIFNLIDVDPLSSMYLYNLKSVIIVSISTISWTIWFLLMLFKSIYTVDDMSYLSIQTVEKLISVDVLCVNINSWRFD